MISEFDSHVRNAIQWASERVGPKEYRLRCLAFVEDAYGQSSSIEFFGGSTAKESADQYGTDRQTGPPEPNAFMFYDSFGTLNGEYESWGHVGLHVRNGVVIHAWNRTRSDNYLEVQTLMPAPGWTQPEYIGSVPVERILRGHRKR